MGYKIAGGKHLYILAQGRLVGHSAAEASPADVMDLTFTLMAMTVEWAATRPAQFVISKVILPPADFTERVASMKLAAIGVAHDRLSESQREYIHSWAAGT